MKKELGALAVFLSLATAAWSRPIEWVPIVGGKFVMGIDQGFNFQDAKPAHEVVIKPFQMSKTLVTVEQYAECVGAGQCTKPGNRPTCNWEKFGRGQHPVTCVNWSQAQQYAKFEGARLPSESEWEYAARSEGKNQKYPWGDEEATCDRAVMYGNHDTGCDTGRTMAVCSKPQGNTDQGLCDMAGNVWEWVEDAYHNSYQGAPVDGSAFEGPGSSKVLRGGSLSSPARLDGLRTNFRYTAHLDESDDDFGFRLVRANR